MIHELDRTNFDAVRPLFQSLARRQPFCAAVLAGIHPGRIFVDDRDRPQAAFMIREDGWCFLAGDPAGSSFDRALNRAVIGREIVPRGVRSLFVTCDPQDWHGHLAVVLYPRQPIPVQRRQYVCRALDYDWRARLPEGFAVQRMDEGLLSRPGFQLPEEVRETLERWRQMAGPSLQDFGYVAIHGNEVVSWATVDAIVDGVGDAGLFTLPAYRRRGLATVTAAAAVEYGLGRGLSAVIWTCGTDNTASIRTAERLGLERHADYRFYYFLFDEAEHLAILGYRHLQEQRYREAADLLEQAFALEEGPPVWAYCDAARAWAALGEQAKALERLTTAVDWGWLDIEDLSEFESLHGTAGWSGLLERVRKTKKALGQ